MADDALLRDMLTLHLVPGIGPRTMELLISSFGDAATVLARPEDELLRVPGIGPKLARAIRAAARGDEACRELARCEEFGAALLSRDGGGDYPRLLREIPDAPAILYRRGTFTPADEIAVAIVGSRRCTYYGQAQAEKLAGGLARAGLTVVSGLAKGIDAAAHRGALNAGGRTIAVTATGLDTVYPPEHAELAEQVVAAGAILTECRFAQPPTAGMFPQRNRIISGISLGVIVVEASRRSGALHTARHATEQNRDVFAVPGRVDSLASGGCHDLIRDGATLIEGVDDVLSHLGPLLRPVQVGAAEDNSNQHPPAERAETRAREIRTVAELSLSEQEQAVLGKIGGDPVAVDTLLAALEIEPSRILATLTVLEMKRLVRRLPGNAVVRAS